MKRSAVLLAALAVIGCASGGGDSPGGYVATSNRGQYQNIQFEPGGRVFGENFDFMTTESGYRGLLRGELAMMESSDGERITGSRGGIPIDLHFELDGMTIRASGLFAGRLGKLQVDAAALKATFGHCSMDLHRGQGMVYTGQSACSDGRIGPAVIQLPEEFRRLPVHRQVMLLAVMLYI